MATTIRAQYTLQNVDSIPRDVAVNTWHYRSNGLLEGDLDDIQAQLEDFYTAIQGLLSTALSGTIGFKLYDLVDPNPRVPVRQGSFDITTGDEGQMLPSECAICLSFRGAEGSGLNARRSRGRVFLGPLDLGVIGNRTTDAEVIEAARLTIGNAAGNLLAASLLSTATWSVFSPTTAGAEPWAAGDLSVSTIPIEAGYVDDAFDTIRSRGVGPLNRTTFP